ncbi:MAG: glycosyltransferase family 4 protein, partial [Planctomycetaceae bacterium]|nr:glycosyltransferase family 4 protein [Planctomycetaceae bacterium]
LPTHQMISDAASKIQIHRICHHRWFFGQAAIDWFNKYDADHHLFVSDALMQELIRESGALKASSRKVVYDGFTLPYVPVQDDRLAARRELGLSEEKSIVLFAEEVVEQKGVADLIHAWHSLADKWREQAELHIVGKAPVGEEAYRREMERLADGLGCPVSFHGYQRNVDQWLIASDIVMVPSHGESLGNITLEAMAQARPVIGGDAGRVSETVVHNKTGYLVPPRKPESLAVALELLLESPRKRLQYGEAARRRCEEMFSLETHTQAVLSEYDRVLSKSPMAVHS